MLAVLFTLGDINCVRGVLESKFFKRNRNFTTVWCRPCVKVDHLNNLRFCKLRITSAYRVLEKLADALTQARKRHRCQLE